MDIYAKIKAEIKSRRISILQMAADLGITQTTIYYLNENTRVGNILKIINYLYKTPCDFFCENKTVDVIAENKLNEDYKKKYLELIEKHIKLLDELRVFKDPVNQIKKT